MRIRSIGIYILAIAFLVNPSAGNSQLAVSKGELATIKAKNVSTKFINTFDYDCDYFMMKKGVGYMAANTELSIDPEIKYQGIGSLKCKFGFVGSPHKEEAEIITVSKTWGNYRPDLSFHPLGISLWVKSSTPSDSKLIINLLQQNENYTLSNESLKVYTFTSTADLGKTDWQQVVIPYSWFKGQDGNADINLRRIVGYEFGIENTSKKPHDFTVNFDSFQQLTSFDPVFPKNAKFSSIFIQLHAKPHEHLDWTETFKAYKEVGIDTVIVQQATRHDKTGSITNYQGTKLPNIVKQHRMIENVFEAANKTGMKVILGLNAGKYPIKKSDTAVYEKLLETNKTIVDELYEKFSDDRMMVGWYISEEFHDGSWRGWWKPEDTYLLADYNERVAAYAKAKPKKFLVAIAPALWRGRPADMTYTFYKRILEKTPSVDILYLQDCAGRRNIINDDLVVDLSNYFAMVKKACDETGVQFGVDIESFTKGNCKTTYGTKSWEELKLLVNIAGMYTKNISQFSWASFRPGVGAFDDYRRHMLK